MQAPPSSFSRHIHEDDEPSLLKDLVVEEAEAAGEDDGAVSLALDDLEGDTGGGRLAAACPLHQPTISALRSGVLGGTEVGVEGRSLMR